jgi:formate dehydrogenase subunit beta
MNTIIPVENGETLVALRGFLRQLLESGAVEALYVSLGVDSGVIAPALVTDPALLDQADPLTPVMPINGARAVSALTGKRAPARLGVVLRPCEIRALVELVKLQQADLENVIVIGLDCPGTYELTDYVDRHRAGKADLREYLALAREGNIGDLDGMPLRHACQMCDQPVPEHTDIHIGLFGAGAEKGLPVEINDEIAESLQLPAAPGILPDGRQSVVDRLVAERRQTREKELASMHERLDANGGVSGLFATCIRCHNCMTVCPICYCKTCLFKTASFDHQPEHYLTAARRKGATRLLGDTMLFHMTRLNHMSLSCVSCGMCTSACPADIPVGLVFSAIGARVQASFEYRPGRELSETLPLITFQPNEWTEVGEAR